MRPHRPWKEQRLSDTAWKPPKGLSRVQRTAEQDRAAGGHAARQITLHGNRRAQASVALKPLPQGRRVYAYLRWSVGGKTQEKYLGEVDKETREENLRQAWRAAHKKGLLTMASSDASLGARATGSWATSAASRAVMRANPGRDTRPERALRSAAHRLGLRYRVNRRPVKELRRTADLVFPGAKVAVFLDGCFWHGCREHHRPAKSATSGFWNDKIAANRRRDADTDMRLREAGWRVVRVWEHEDPDEAAHKVAALVRAAQAQR